MEPSQERENGWLSWRWHVGAFLTILGLVAFLLWGVYRPVMRHFSTRYMDRGDLFLQHGLSLNDNLDSATATMLNAFEEKVLVAYSAQQSYEHWARQGGGVDANNLLFREETERYASLAPVLTELGEEARALLVRAGRTETFGYLLDNVDRKIAMGLPKIKNLEANIRGAFSVKEAYDDCSYLGYAVMPDLLEASRQIQSLYDRESCFDIAMMEFTTAIAFGRSWSRPRLRMAELYHRRDWPEFAMLECLKVMKLDPDGDDGRKAEAILVSFDGRHPEADYYIGLARLLRNDRGEGERLLRRFVARHPTIPNAPKAWNLLTHMEQGHDPFIRHFLRDEIWI